MDLHFIKTVERPDEGWVAMFVDEDVVGASGVEAMRSASKIPKVFNTIRTREGVHFLGMRAVEEKMVQMKKLIEDEK